MPLAALKLVVPSKAHYIVEYCAGQMPLAALKQGKEFKGFVILCPLRRANAARGIETLLQGGGLIAYSKLRRANAARGIET